MITNEECERLWNENEKTNHLYFIQCMKDGNVFRVSRGVYTTQCAQWKNILTYKELKEYYIREYVRS